MRTHPERPGSRRRPSTSSRTPRKNQAPPTSRSPSPVQGRAPLSGRGSGRARSRPCIPPRKIYGVNQRCQCRRFPGHAGTYVCSTFTSSSRSKSIATVYRCREWFVARRVMPLWCRSKEQVNKLLSKRQSRRTFNFRLLRNERPQLAEAPAVVCTHATHLWAFSGIISKASSKLHLLFI